MKMKKPQENCERILELAIMNLLAQIKRRTGDFNKIGLSHYLDELNGNFNSKCLMWISHNIKKDKTTLKIIFEFPEIK